MALRHREAAHPCPRLLPRIGLKAGWVWAEAPEAPHCPPGCPWPAQRPLESNPLQLWAPLAQSYWGILSHPAPPCLTTSLAPVGSFLEMTWSRAGDCGQEAGWEGSAGEPDRREKGQAGGAGSGAGGEHADARCWVPCAGPDVAASRWRIHTWGEVPNLSPPLRAVPKWGHLVTSHPLPWGPAKEKDLT